MTDPMILKDKKRIGVITPSYGDSVSRLFDGIGRYARSRRDFVIHVLQPTQIDALPSRRKFDGFITDAVLRSHIEALKRYGAPIVDLSGEAADDPSIIPVNCEVEKIADVAADVFLLRGFSSFAYLGLAGKRDSDVIAARLKARAKAAGCSFSASSCILMPPPAAKAKRAPSRLRTPTLKKWVSTLPRRTAVLCLNDGFAINLMDICMAAGRDIPGDLALMGTNNNISQCMFAPITLSSIDTNYSGAGYAAMRILASAIDNPVMPKRRRPFLVPIGFAVERESTAAYPVKPPWLAEAMAFFDAGIDRPLSVQDIADSVGVSQTALQNAFRKALGMSVSKYMLTVRMREAGRMVSEATLSVKEIAAKLGFSSRSYFSHVFTSYYGRPPSAAKGTA